MTESDQKRLNELILNVRRLLERLESRELELASLKDENKTLKVQLDTMRIAQDSMAKKYENLKVAQALTGEVSGNHAARQKINTIVREIDKCLALLNR